MNEFTFSLVPQAVRVFVSPTTFVHLIVHRHRAFHWQSVANSRTKCGSRARMAVKQPAIMEGQFVPKYWKYYNLRIYLTFQECVIDGGCECDTSKGYIREFLGGRCIKMSECPPSRGYGY